MTSSDSRSVAEWAAELVTKEEASKLATRLHLLSLLFEVRTTYTARHDPSLKQDLVETIMSWHI